MNCSDDWIDALNYSMWSLNNFKKEMENWLDKNRPAYKHYSSTFGRKPGLVRKNARCVPPIAINPALINEITYENGNISFHYGVGKMNLKNLKILRMYLESNGIEVCGVCNEEVFGVKVIRIVIAPCQDVNAVDLAQMLCISKTEVYDVTGDLFYVKLSALAKHYHDGVLKIKKPFKLTNVTFNRSNLKGIKKQLCRELNISEFSFDVDIWDDCLMIKSDGSYLANLTRMDIARALDINDGYVHCIDNNKWYYILKWD